MLKISYFYNFILNADNGALVFAASDSNDEVTLEDLETYSDQFDSLTHKSNSRRDRRSDSDNFTPVSSIHTSMRTHSSKPFEKSPDKLSRFKF